MAHDGLKVVFVCGMTMCARVSLKKKKKGIGMSGLLGYGLILARLYFVIQICLVKHTLLFPSSNPSSTTSLASSSPQSGPLDWAVPQASRLKYRQQFNSLDRQMFGYLSGMLINCFT